MAQPITKKDQQPILTEEWQLKAIEKGLKEIDSGKIISHAELLKQLPKKSS